MSSKPFLRCLGLLVCGLMLICVPIAMRAQTSDWDVQVTPFNQIFSALELSEAPRSPALRDQPVQTDVIGPGNGLIALHVRARHANELVRVRIDAPPWLIAASQMDAPLAQAGEQYELHPALHWNPQRLAAQTTAVATVLHITLIRDGKPAGEREIKVDLRPLDEALYFVRDGADSVDLSWIFAAFVNEHDQVVDRILDAATQSGIVENFTGYASEDSDRGTSPAIDMDQPTRGAAVLRQVWAIWHALNARGIRYSGADPGIDRGPHVFSQRVRLLADTWTDRSANCIDSSVLLASALQRIGLRTFLVLVPGHAFVGFYTDAQSRDAAYLETTVLGSHLAMPRARPDYARALYLSPDAESSLASFDAALRAGTARHASDASRLDGNHRPDYSIIDIVAARDFGIAPIAFPTLKDTATGAP